MGVEVVKVVECGDTEGAPIIRALLRVNISTTRK